MDRQNPSIMVTNLATTNSCFLTYAWSTERLHSARVRAMI